MEKTKQRTFRVNRVDRIALRWVIACVLFILILCAIPYTRRTVVWDWFAKTYITFYYGRDRHVSTIVEYRGVGAHNYVAAAYYVTTRPLEDIQASFERKATHQLSENYFLLMGDWTYCEWYPSGIPCIYAVLYTDDSIPHDNTTELRRQQINSIKPGEVLIEYQYTGLSFID
ncbi:MAG: hypothetical protein AAF787_20680 [Chloroflexota bacterium]